MDAAEKVIPEEDVATDVSHNGIPLFLQDDQVVTNFGLSLLEGVDSAALVNASESVMGDLVLGFHSKQGQTAIHDFVMGKLCCERFVSSARCKLWWMTPEWGSTAQDLVPETQFLLVEMQEGGPYAILLPLIEKGIFRATLRPPAKYRRTTTPPPVPSMPKPDPGMVLRLESGDENVKGDEWESVLFMAAGWDPFALLDRCIAAAAKLSGGARARTEKTLPASLDVFGWCTWDAFYNTVSAKGIVEGLNTLKEGGFLPKLLIIDDGWQMTGLDHDHHTPKKRSLPSINAKYPSPPINATENVPLKENDMISMVPETSETDPEDSGTTLQRAFGTVVKMVSSACLWAYECLVQRAPPGSARVRAFTYLANGPLRSFMLNFYATEGAFSRRLTSIKANGKFSSPDATKDTSWKQRTENLADVIQYLKEEMHVEYVYLWHGLSAYWSGVSHQRPDMAKYNPRLLKAKPTPGILEVEPELGWNPSVVAGVGLVDKPEDLYTDMHHYLQSAGATGVKVDAQAGVGLLGSVSGGGAALAYKWHVALEASVEKHFPGNHVINCMCHSTENLYRMLNTAVARASDDFYPRDRSSITPHIANCAYNALFMSPLVQPDWDMFQTLHEAADLHAAARVVSGGAIYISDKPGQHNFDVLRQLVLPNGSILRPLLPGRPTRDCLFRNILKDGKTLLKIWTRNAFTGIVGVFNLQGASWDRTSRRFKTHNAKPPTLQTKVTPKDVECLVNLASKHRLFCKKYVAYGVRQKKLIVGNETLCLCVQLEAFGSEIVSFSPVLRLSDVEFSPIGFPHLLNGSGSIQNCSGRRVKLSQFEFHMTEGFRNQPVDKCTLFDVAVKGCGDFLMYATKEPKIVWLNDQSVPFEYESHKLTVHVAQNLPSLENCIQVLFAEF